MADSTTPTDHAGLQALARENGWRVTTSIVNPRKWWASRDTVDDVEEIEVVHTVDGSVAVGSMWWPSAAGSGEQLPTAADVRAALEWKE